MADIIVLSVVLICLSAALLYIRKEKKKGIRCIGCPAAGTCAARQKNGDCGCEGTFSCGDHIDDIK